MSCKANSTSKSIKFKPMPMAALIANLKTLPATYDSTSDSSEESNSSFDKFVAYSKKSQQYKSNTPKPSSHVKVPLAENRSGVKSILTQKTPGQLGRVSNKENCFSRNYGVDVLPTIEASGTTSQSVTVESLQSAQKLPSFVEKKESARCLFPKPPNESPPKEPPLLKKPLTHKEPPLQAPILKAPPTPVQPAILVEPPTPIQSQILKEAPTPKQPHTLKEPPTPKQPPTLTETQNPRAVLGPPTDIHSDASNSQSTQLRPPTILATPSQPQGPKNDKKLHFKSINIKGKKYMVIKKLGTGGSSDVFKILEVSTLNEFAVKCVNLETDRKMAQGYVNEVKLLRDLQKSDRVIKLYDYEYDRARKLLRLVMEVGETDLAIFLRAHSDGAPPALVLHYWEEMLRAVRQIHEHGIVHADLKPANFMLVSGRLKLIDFGIASAVSSEATSVVRSCGQGTFSYISPEALGGDGTQPIKVSFYSDVWSLGCILYSLVYGRTPFAHFTTVQVKLATIKDPKHNIAYPPVDNIPPSLIRVLQACLRYDAHSRPTVAELLQIKHLEGPAGGLPEGLLDKLRPHVTPEEYRLLQNARVKED